MQHILTDDEYRSLVPRKELTDLQYTLNDVCLIAKNALLKASKFKCIHEQSHDSEIYCDDCPVVNCNMDLNDVICKEDKEWSK